MTTPNLDLLLSGIEILVGYLDSFGTAYAPGEDLYFELMGRNTEEIRKCVGLPTPEADGVPTPDGDDAGEIGGRGIGIRPRSGFVCARSTSPLDCYQCRLESHRGTHR